MRLKLFDFTLFLGVYLATWQLMEITGSIGLEIDAIESWIMPCPNDGRLLSESLRVCIFCSGHGISLIIVVHGCNHISAWSVGVGWDVDTSMFLRTVASPETLNG
jgi:hypothetical protein